MNSFNELKNVEELFDFFKERKLILQEDYDDVSDELKKSSHNYFEFSSEGYLVLISSYEGIEDIKIAEREFMDNIFVNYIFLVRDDFNEYLFLKYDEGTGKTLKLKKKKADLNASFLKKIENLEYDNIDSFDKIFDRSEFIKEFYDLYCNSEEYLTKNIKGISDEGDKELFAQLIIQRIMFLWFLQKKGFLDNDLGYFINKFNLIATKNGNFYKDFLKKLFFEGLCKKESERDDLIVNLIGNIKYLNGGLFVESDIELKYGNAIEIENGIFYKENFLVLPNEKNIPIINLMDSRDWTIDETSGEIGKLDPEVLGYIFERSINQKTLGAVYTPEDITTYISKNTVYPYICDKLNQKFGMEYEYGDIHEDFLRKLNLKQSKYLFRIIKDLKIIDPAAGSGHFLVDSIIILERLYKFLREKEIIGWSNFKIREYIITETLFGVDLLKGASEICKLRLFLALAETFNSIEDIKPLPNIEFNIRCGNSLIGFNSQSGLDQEFFSKGPIREILHNNMAFFRNQCPLIAEEVSKILSNFGAINPIILFKIRNDLVREYRKLHNHSIQTELRSVIYQITRVFNDELNNNFYKNIVSDLKKEKSFQIDYSNFASKNKGKAIPSLGAFINSKFLNMNPFHWVMEYSEVIDKGGFDIVIGNPPYISADRDDPFVIDERKFLKKIKTYTTLFERWDMFIPFIQLGLKLTKKTGYFSFIVEDSYNASKYTTKSHEFVLDNAEIKELHFCSDAHIFEGVGVKNTIFVLKNGTNKQNIPKRIKHTQKFGNSQVLHSVSQEEGGRDLFNPIKDFENKINLKNTMPLEEICYISYGLRPNANEKKYKGAFKKDDLISTKKDNEHPILYVEGKMIGKFQIKEFKFLEWGTERSPKKIARPTFPELYREPKILFGNITNCTYDEEGFFCNHSITVITPWENIKGVYNRSISKKAKKERRPYYEENSKKFSLKYIFLLINSKLVRYVVNQDKRNKLSIYPGDLSNVPIKKTSLDKQLTFEILTNYLLFLNSTEESGNSHNSMINYFEEIFNKTVYELYLIENLNEDGIYPELENYLLNSISDHLKQIKYDDWKNIYWKNVINHDVEDLNDEEFIKIKNSNLKIIKETYNALTNDDKIMNQIKKIESYEWVKRIEKSLSE